jgi:lysozyme family protein
MYETMKVLPSRKVGMDAVARLVYKHKQRYLEVCDALDIDEEWWMLVGCLHYRESSCNFGTHLANGDSLEHKTIHDPKDEPPGNPPFSWEYAAEWALRDHGAQHLPEFDIAEFAYFAEGYNGWGYAERGETSAYLWSGTDKHASGKFIRDHVYSPVAVDPQDGVMPILAALMAMEQPAEAVPVTQSSPVVRVTVPATPVAPTAPKSILRQLWEAIRGPHH